MDKESALRMIPDSQLEAKALEIDAGPGLHHPGRLGAGAEACGSPEGRLLWGALEIERGVG